MTNLPDVNTILSEASGQENEYDWLGAIETYKRVLGLVPEKDISGLGEVHERLGYALQKAGMQAEDMNQFKDRMHKAIESFEKASGYYSKLGVRRTEPRILRCNAMTTYIVHWLATEVSEKKTLLDESLRLTRESLEAFEESGDHAEYGKTHNQLSCNAIFLFTRESNFKSRENVIREAVESGEKAIEFLSDSDDPSELARAYARTVVCLGIFGYYFHDVDEREKYRQKGLSYWAQAKELSEEVAFTEFLYPVFGGQPFFGLEGTDEAIANYEKALEYGKKTKDRFFIGCALDWLTYHTGWRITVTEDPDAGGRLIERAVRYAEEAKLQFSVMSFVSPRGDLAWLEGIEVSHWLWSAGYETDMKKKRDLYEKVSQAFPDLRKRGEDSGYPEIRMFVSFSDAGFRVQLAQSETNLANKREILEEAVSQGNRSHEIAEHLEPFLYWNRGIMHNTLSAIKTELANLTEEPEAKKTLLQQAITSKEDATTLLIKELKFLERKGSATSLFATVGGQYYTYGNLLVSLYDLTENRELLRKATKAYEDAIGFLQKLSLVTYVAETYWKKAQVYDKLGEHVSAYQSFEMARANFAFASESIVQLRDSYHDKVVYMHAWSQIEKARQHHEKQEYGLAEEHFKKASKLHEQLKRWGYLSPNYAAWGQMDRAEELSRKEDSEEALRAFETAAGLFEETQKSLQNQLDKIEDFEEKRMVKDMLKATGIRHQYCMARIAVEEAKVFDKRGDHFSSSRKYNSAAEILEKIGKTTESARDKRELMLTATLSKAWAKMALAEAEEDPSPYAEASQLFEKAKDLSSNEKAKTLTLGHSHFCRALEAGMRFTDTGDETLHTTAIQHLESAGRYYVKADCQSASEYAKATEMLLDAYSSMNNAKKEADSEKKTRLLAVAEKILQTSAGYFMKAEHPEKREQVLRLLEKVKEERELAQSLNEVLHTPSVISATAAFATLTPGQESSLDLWKFENANIQANIIARQKQLEIGENLELKIELINAGKFPAQLIKVTELIPSGFELMEKPEFYRVEDSYVDMRGKRLGPLKTEELELVLKPRAQGTFTFKPTILYLDESGKYKSYEPEPVNIKVKELGIKGWLRG
jgi:uncharacterized repeat protein (TIGR01451 family)